MTTVAPALDTDRLFTERGVDEMAWECVVGNAASASVARKAGFRFTGERPTALTFRDGTHPASWHGVLRAEEAESRSPDGRCDRPARRALRPRRRDPLSGCVGRRPARHHHERGAVVTGRQLEQVGIASRIEHVIASGELGFTKPDPRIFAHACAVFGVGPSDAVYVGDRLNTDAIGAADAGLVGVWLDRSGAATVEESAAAAASGVVVIRSLDRLIPALG